MRIKGMDGLQVRKWNRILKERGYLPHHHQVGRVKMEVRFLLCPSDKKWWTVINLVTGQTLEFWRNGTPRNGTRGRLIGPIVSPRKVHNGSKT